MSKWLQEKMFKYLINRWGYRTMLTHVYHHVSEIWYEDNVPTKIHNLTHVFECEGRMEIHDAEAAYRKAAVRHEQLKGPETEDGNNPR